MNIINLRTARTETIVGIVILGDGYTLLQNGKNLSIEKAKITNLP